MTNWAPWSHSQRNMAKPLELRPAVTLADPTVSGRSWPVHSWARYIQLCPWTPLIGAGPSPLLYAGMRTRAQLGV